MVFGDSLYVSDGIPLSLKQRVADSGLFRYREVVGRLFLVSREILLSNVLATAEPTKADTVLLTDRHLHNPSVDAVIERCRIQTSMLNCSVTVFSYSEEVINAVDKTGYGVSLGVTTLEAG